MHNAMMLTARGMAYLGGLMLAFLVVMTCISILGRELNAAFHSDFVQGIAPGLANWLLGLGIGAINGDYELIEAGIAFSIFAFLPYCQLTGGHATVDIFTSRLPAAINRVLTMLWSVIFAAVLILIAIQLCAGMISKVRSGQTTFLLEFPIWWAYALSLSGAVLAAIMAVYISIMRILELVKGAALLPLDPGAER